MTNPSIPNTVPLTDRINAEPAILRGLSQTEAGMILGVSFVVGTLLAWPFGVLIGHLWVAPVLMAAIPVAVVWISSGWFQKVKRDRPDFYYQHMLKIWRHKTCRWPARYETHSGVWELGRSFPIIRRSWFRWFRKGE